MRAIFFCQGPSLQVFYELYRALARRTPVERAGFYVANYSLYNQFLAEHPGFEQEFAVEKEWALYEAAEHHRPDRERLAARERELGDPTLWSPVVVDRRLSMGSDCTFRQDYASPWSHDRLLALLDVATERIAELFDTVKPNVIFTLYTATFGDCLGHAFARARGIRALDVVQARMQNRIMIVDGVADPPPHMAAWQARFAAEVPAQLRQEAEAYLTAVRERHAMYEGVVPAARHKRESGVAHVLSTWCRPATWKGLARSLVADWRRRSGPARYDPQVRNATRSFLFGTLVRPLRRTALTRRLQSRLVQAVALKGMDYAVYPLHTEPELVLAQFVRPFQNQIEVVRNIAYSLPVGMKLLVKEHPLMVGRRPVAYYQKLLDLPNVLLAAWDMPSEAALDGARLVLTLRSAMGLEAAIRRIPVVGLGRALFNLLPDHMYQTCHNLYRLGETIRLALTEYRYDEEALICFLAAVIRGSVPVNLLTDFLGKGGLAFSGEEAVPLAEHPHLAALADHVAMRLGEPAEATADAWEGVPA